MEQGSRKRRLSSMRRTIAVLAVIILSVPLYADIVAYPAKSQSAEVQSNDETYCKGWAINKSDSSKTSVDEGKTGKVAGSTVKGAAAGAAGGAVMGQVLAGAPGR